MRALGHKNLPPQLRCASLRILPGQPKRKAKREAELAAKRNGHNRPTHEDIAEVYRKNTWSNFEALRTALVQNGIVEHGLNPYDVIQRAIDDVALDYLLLRRTIDKDADGDPEKLTSHDLYMDMEHARECMVRYSTFAMQYDIQQRQLKLTESRVALLAASLRVVLINFDIPPERLREIPRMLIDALAENTPYGLNGKGPRLDENRALAMAEIISNPDIEIEITPEADAIEGEAKDLS